MPYQEVKNKIDSIKHQITAHGKLDDNQLKKINYKFRLEWNYNSNSMEGNTLTIAETRSVMVGNLDVHQKPLHDVLEMKGHDEIVSDILKIGKGELRLSEKRIQQIHKAIIHESDEIRKEQIGVWKKQANEIINYKGEKYGFAAPDEVPEKMHDLLNRTNAALDAVFAKKKNAPHPLDVAFKFHLEVLDIHPFHDGNGRVARILSNLILIATGYPPFWITKPERTTYYNYIADIQGYGGKPDLFYEYMAGLVLRSQQLVLDVVEGKDIEDEDDIYKEISLWKKQLVKNEKLVSYSDTLAADLYFKYFKPLFSHLLERLSEFEDLFDKKEITNYFIAHKHFSHKANALEYFDDAFEIIIGKSKISGKDSGEYKAQLISNLNTLQLQVYYQGFKNDGTNTFGASVIIEIYFSTYRYDIYTDNKIDRVSLLTKLYSEELTDAEIKTIVKTTVSNLFKNIKSSIKN